MSENNFSHEVLQTNTSNKKKYEIKHVPLQIITVNEDHIFELNETLLESLLMQDHIKDKHVAVVSVAGAFRKGKSFLLDFCLRYMNNEGNANWLGDNDAPLLGFSWRGGSERDTSGILLWDEVFLVTLSSGEEVAVLLMDTQGIFDSESTVKDCITVFALSTMISSIQVYNLSQNIQEDDLQNLQPFTEYGRLALQDTKETPFQNLVFLVRDWSFPYEAEYGIDGGQKILNRRLQISDHQHPELQQLRKHIQSCFAIIKCFLLPHPGLKVAINPYFDGRLNDIESNFKEQIKILIPSLLSKENLKVKEINGKKITALELLDYFKVYVKVYQGDKLPEPKTMLEATITANNLAAVNIAKDYYFNEMQNICGGDKPYVELAELESNNRNIKANALDMFKSTRKMGESQLAEFYYEKLETVLNEYFEYFQDINMKKNIFPTNKTPEILFTMIISLYISSGIISLFGLDNISNICTLFIGTLMTALVLWTYVTYTGKFLEIGISIDKIANFFGERLLNPLYNSVFGERQSQPYHLVLENQNPP